METRKLLSLKEFSESPACRVVFRRDARFGQRIEQGGFSDVRQANDAALQTHEKPSKTGVEVYSIQGQITKNSSAPDKLADLEQVVNALQHDGIHAKSHCGCPETLKNANFALASKMGHVQVL
jgi:hypothetical protein